MKLFYRESHEPSSEYSIWSQDLTNGSIPGLNGCCHAAFAVAADAARGNRGGGGGEDAGYATFLNLFVRLGCHHAPFSTTPSETIFLSPVMCSPVTSA